jgi:hypothetical protein
MSNVDDVRREAQRTEGIRVRRRTRTGQLGPATVLRHTDRGLLYEVE